MKRELKEKKGVGRYSLYLKLVQSYRGGKQYPQQRVLYLGRIIVEDDKLTLEEVGKFQLDMFKKIRKINHSLSRKIKIPEMSKIIEDIGRDLLKINLGGFRLNKRLTAKGF